MKTKTAIIAMVFICQIAANTGDTNGHKYYNKNDDQPLNWYQLIELHHWVHNTTCLFLNEFGNEAVDYLLNHKLVRYVRALTPGVLATLTRLYKESVVLFKNYKARLDVPLNTHYEYRGHSTNPHPHCPESEGTHTCHGAPRGD